MAAAAPTSSSSQSGSGDDAPRTFKEAQELSAQLAALCEGTDTKFLGGFYGLAGLPVVVHFTPGGPQPFQLRVLGPPATMTVPEDQRALAFCAVKDGKLEVVRDLVAKYPGLLVEPMNDMKQGILHCAAYYRNSGEVFGWLMKQPDMSLTVRSRTDKIPLQYAISGLNLNVLRQLVILPECGIESLKKSDFPPYLEGAVLGNDTIQSVFSMMELLPSTLHLWDQRWVAFYNQEHPDVVTKRAKPAETTPAPAELCVICMESEPTTVVIPCMHRVVCTKCSESLRTDAHNSHVCVVCRQPIDGIYDQITGALAEPGESTPN